MLKIGDAPGSWRVRHDRIPPELVDILYSLAQKLAAFDAEGHVDVGVRKYLLLTVGAENSNRRLLQEIRQLLKTALNVASRIYRKRKKGSTKAIRGKTFVMRHTSYSLIIARIEDVKRFAATVGFSIQRKTRKLEDVLVVCSTFAPRDRPAEWKKLYLKERGEWVRRESAPPFQSKGIKQKLSGLRQSGR
jgi:hypothetical protein